MLFRSSWLSFYFDAHATSGASDNLDRGLVVGGIQVVLFDLHNLEQLGLGDFSNLVSVGFARTLCNARCFLK